jgi:hypothetical protein
MSYPESTGNLPFPTLVGAKDLAQPSEVEREIMDLYERFRDPLLRYALCVP